MFVSMFVLVQQAAERGQLSVLPLSRLRALLIQGVRVRGVPYCESVCVKGRTSGAPGGFNPPGALP